MEAILQDLEQVQNEDVEALMAIDERFHRLLYQAADNKFLAEMLNHLYALGLRLWHLVLDRLEDVWGAVEQHRGIVELLKAGDGARAEALIRQQTPNFNRRFRLCCKCQGSARQSPEPALLRS